MTGIYPAQSFFQIDRSGDSGRITLIRDLREDSLQMTQYILRVVAYDSVYPDHTVTHNVVVNVARNQHGPEFVPGPVYSKVISDGFSVGEEVMRVRANDEDEQVYIHRRENVWKNIHSEL